MSLFDRFGEGKPCNHKNVCIGYPDCSAGEPLYLVEVAFCKDCGEMIINKNKALKLRARGIEIKDYLEKKKNEKFS